MIKSLSYSLPREFIAQIPLEKREEARLLVLSRGSGRIEHMVFKNIVNLLDERDVVVLNNTKVFPARLYGKSDGGGKVEVLLIREREPLVWEVMGRPAKRLKINSVINFDHGNFRAEVLERRDKIILKFLFPGGKNNLDENIYKYGTTPLPHYIKRPHPEINEEFDRRYYQTVYAASPGSCACPTAGLHFTKELLDALKDKGVEIVEVTLHIGPGTFRPIKVNDLKSHCMEEESFVIPERASFLINSARRKGKNIVAVGTSSVRALEEAGTSGRVNSGKGDANIFIYPGYRFKIVNSLITNFHYSASAPLAMVSAFAGEGLISKAYGEAIREGYRFLSYGDSMFIRD